MKKVLLLSALVLLLSSCLEYQEKMKINENGSGEITFAIGISESIFKMGGESPEIKEFDENKIKEKYQNQQGVKFLSSKNYSKDGNRWIEVKISFDSIDNLMLASKDSTSKDLIGKISLKKNADGNMVFERIISTKDEKSEQDTASADMGKGMMEAMFGSYKWRYELTVPGNIITTNAEANDVDKNTNTIKWVMSMASLTTPKTLSVVYGSKSSFNVTYILLVVVACLILGFVLLRLLKRKKDVDVQS